MYQTTKRLVSAAGVAALLSATTFVVPALAQDTPAPTDQAPADPVPEPAEAEPDTVLATVNGVEITEVDMALAAEDLGQQLQQMPPQQQRPFLLRILIDMKVMADAAREEGLADSETFQRRLDYLEDRTLRQVYFGEVVAGSITQEQIQSRYDEAIAGFEPQEEIRARHILVETEEEANNIVSELEGGADFAELAQEHSTDPGAANGGDLGYFTEGMMVPEFSDVAFALEEAGDVSEPVQSQFGWHVIKLEDRRESSPPPIEQVGPQIQQQVLMEAFDGVVADLMANADIEIIDEQLRGAIEGQPATGGDAGGDADAAPADADGAEAGGDPSADEGNGSEAED